MTFEMLYDVVRAPHSTTIFSPDGRAFEVRELSIREMQTAHAGLARRDDWEAVAEGLPKSEADTDHATLRAEYNGTALGIGRVLDGDAARYGVRPASVAVLMAGVGV